MRAIIFGTLLALTACGEDQAETTDAAVEGGAATEVLPTNDVTAIDAVTGDSANMAADVELGNALNETEPVENADDQ